METRTALATSAGIVLAVAAASGALYVTQTSDAAVADGQPAPASEIIVEYVDSAGIPTTLASTGDSNGVVSTAAYEEHAEAEAHDDHEAYEAYEDEHDEYEADEAYEAEHDEYEADEAYEDEHEEHEDHEDA